MAVKREHEGQPEIKEEGKEAQGEEIEGKDFLGKVGTEPTGVKNRHRGKIKDDKGWFGFSF